jgi:hypothetical protein
MGYQVIVDDKRKLVISRWDRIVTQEMITEYLQSVWQNPAVIGYDELCIFLQIQDHNLSNQSIEALARLAGHTHPTDRASKVALVTREPEHYGVARIYQAQRHFVDQGLRRVKVFHDIASAEAWLSQEDAHG